MSDLVSDKISISKPLKFIIISVFLTLISIFFLSGILGLYLKKDPLQIEYTREIFKDFENKIDKNFILANKLKPNVQKFLLFNFKKGNKKVHIGKENYLFFVDDTQTLIYKKHCDNKDKVLKNFKILNEYFKKKQIKFYVGILPSKSQIMHDKYNNINLSLNSNYNGCYSSVPMDLKKQGLKIFDLSNFYNDLNTKNKFLKYDSHWSFESMELFAKLIAETLKNDIKNLNTNNLNLKKNKVLVQNYGDLYDMLDINNTNLKKQQIYINQIVSMNSNDITKDKNSSITLIGDSFTNIYSDKSLKWGEKSGLAYQLSYRLKKTINSISSNGSAFKTSLIRNFLYSNDMKKNSVVILIMAERELKNIKEAIEINKKMPNKKKNLVSNKINKKSILVTKQSKLINNSTPYQNVLLVHEAKLDENKILIVTWAIKNREKLSTINLNDKLKVTLIPFDEKLKENPKLSTIMMIDETDNYESQIYWIENIVSE